ncbi:MAG: MFS transporter, partial [Actinomadura sp.]
MTHAHGAGRSGLGSVIELQAVNSSGDALVAVALAGTIFFGLDVNQARGQVALYLLVTMAPFALIAPLVGPALDRMRSVRRIAMAGSLVARGLLCWGMAGAVFHGDQVTFLPAAFGVLVLSKAFGVLRTAVTPSVLPRRITLVTANARATFAGLVTAAIAAPLGAGLGVLIGPDWVLRIATLVFILGAVLSMRLPKHVDAPETVAEGAPEAVAEGEGERPPEGRTRWRTLLRVGPVVGEAMQANAVLRAFSGFLILYLAFL